MLRDKCVRTPDSKRSGNWITVYPISNYPKNFTPLLAWARNFRLNCAAKIMRRRKKRSSGKTISHFIQWRGNRRVSRCNFAPHVNRFLLNESHCLTLQADWFEICDACRRCATFDRLKVVKRLPELKFYLFTYFFLCHLFFREELLIEYYIAWIDLNFTFDRAVFGYKNTIVKKEINENLNTINFCVRYFSSRYIIKAIHLSEICSCLYRLIGLLLEYSLTQSRLFFAFLIAEYYTAAGLFRWIPITYLSQSIWDFSFRREVEKYFFINVRNLVLNVSRDLTKKILTSNIFFPLY